MDDLKYALGFVCIFSFTCAVGFGSVIGGNVGASFTYFFALLPIIFLGIGSTAPGIITAVINNVRRKSQVRFVFSPAGFSGGSPSVFEVLRVVTRRLFVRCFCRCRFLLFVV